MLIILLVQSIRNQGRTGPYKSSVLSDRRSSTGARHQELRKYYTCNVYTHGGRERQWSKRSHHITPGPSVPKAPQQVFQETESTGIVQNVQLQVGSDFELFVLFENWLIIENRCVPYLYPQHPD